MFGARRKRIPELLSSNPGKGSEGKTAFARGGRTWTEKFDLVELLASALRKQGYEVRERKPVLELVGSDFVLLPQLAHFQPLEPNGTRTATTIQFHHPALVPNGCFEYQHATGDNLCESFNLGFEQWTQMDLVTLFDSLREKPSESTTFKFDYPPKEGRPGLSRRAVLGPFVHFREEQGSSDCAKRVSDEAKSEGTACQGDDFCPCCFLTRSFESFRRYVECDSFYGLRFYAARNREGLTMADCRVNGEDWEEGAVALRKYAETWPNAGFEFRKQYVVLHSTPK